MSSTPSHTTLDGDPRVPGVTLALWLDTSNASTGTWSDKSGLGNHGTVTGATVDTSNPRRKGLSFDGVDDRVDGAISIADDGACTVFVVASHDHTQTTGVRGRLLDLSDTSATARSIQVTDLFGYRRCERALGDDAGSASYTSLSDAIKVSMCVFGPNHTELWEDGLWHGSSCLAITSRAPTSYRLGMARDGTFPWKGVIYEVRIYSGTMTEQQATRIYRQMLRKWKRAFSFRWPAKDSASSGDPQFLIPPVIPAIVGQPLSIWRDQIHYQDGRRAAVVTSDLTVDYSLRDRWTVTPGSAGDYNFTVTEGAYAKSVTIRASVALVGAPVKRVLFDGDSNTERAATGWVEHFGKALGAQVALIGSLGPAAGYSYKHDGHGGFTFGTFNSGDEVQSTVSPYWNPDTDSLDMVYFSETVGIPDVRITACGQNDVYSSTDATIAANCATSIANANTIHSAVVAAFPGVVTIYCLPPPGNGIPATWDGETQRLQFRRNEQAIGAALLANFGGRESERIFVLGTNALFDCVRGYYFADILHMNTSPGHRQIAKALIAAYTLWQGESAVVRILSATVDGVTPTVLTIVCSEAVTIAAVTGYTLTGTARTISSITSGSGTTTHVLALSGAISEADAPVLHVALTRVAESTTGARKVAVGKLTVTKTNFTPLPIQLGVHTWLRSDDAGASLTLVGSDVSQWSDSSGNARHVTASTIRPSRTADFGDGAPSIHFDGTELIYGSNTLDLNSDFTIIALHRGDGYAFGLTDQAEASTQEGLLMRVISNFMIGYLTQASPTLQHQVNPTGDPGNAWRVAILRRSGSTLKGRVGTGIEHTFTPIIAAGIGCTALALGGYRQNNASIPSSAQDWRELQVFAFHVSDAQLPATIADLQARYPSVP